MESEPDVTVDELVRHIVLLQDEAGHGERYRQGLEDQSALDQQQLTAATEQAGVDKERIVALEERLGVEETLIHELETQGVIDRNEIVNLKVALETARQIGAALGILMITHTVGEEQAFDALKSVSQNQNRKLRDVALDVVRAGTVLDLP